MMMLFALAVSLQDLPGLPDRPYRAHLEIERFLKHEDGVATESGTLWVRPGEALLFESGDPRRPSRLVIPAGRAVERRIGERAARSWDLSRPEQFLPADLWRLDPEALRRKFHVMTDRAPVREGPARVVTRDGADVPPVPVKPGPSARIESAGFDREEGCARVILVPRDPALRRSISSIRLSVDRAAGRILSAVVDSPDRRLTLTVSDVQEAASLDDAAFDLDFSDVKPVEDR